MQLSGWAFERGRGRIAAVYVEFVSGPVAPAAYGIDRPNVRAVFPAAPRDAGFGFTMAAAALGAGTWPVRLHFVTADRQRVAATEPITIVVRQAGPPPASARTR